jgi:hypothetical protein
MSRARHARAMGGSVKPVWNAGEGQMAAKEALEKKKGGAVMHGEGEMSRHRADRPKRARGGAIPGRARGGGVGADMKPLTTASKVKAVTPGELPEKGVPSN